MTPTAAVRSDDDFLAPFRKQYDAARYLEERGELLMRASFQVRDEADGRALNEIAKVCFAEARRIRDDIPVPPKGLMK